MSHMTTSKLRQMKEKGQPITMLTAYDYPTAKMMDEQEVDVILVGDSLGMVVLGYDSTIPVTLDDMLHHTKAVVRAVERAMVVTDLPFLTYHGSFDQTLDACRVLMQQGGTHAVKLEGGAELAPTVNRLTRAGVPVMGHIGLTPQSVNQLGGYKVQGKDLESAQKLLDDALALEEAGAFAIVLECVPTALARKISASISIPTIGIGAGVDCDGQVLVFHDIVQYGSKMNPKFVKRFAHVGEEISGAIEQYVSEVRARQFPTAEHSFHLDDSIVGQLYGGKGVSS
jgi:3-methyl-2-oxobutanoate hydroxymethyltransferase